MAILYLNIKNFIFYRGLDGGVEPVFKFNYVVLSPIIRRIVMKIMTRNTELGFAKLIVHPSSFILFGGNNLLSFGL